MLFLFLFFLFFPFLFFLFNIKEFLRVIIEKSFREARRSELPFFFSREFFCIFSVFFYTIKKFDNGYIFFFFCFLSLYRIHLKSNSNFKKTQITIDPSDRSIENAKDPTNLQSHREETKNRGARDSCPQN